MSWRDILRRAFGGGREIERAASPPVAAPPPVSTSSDSLLRALYGYFPQDREVRTRILRTVSEQDPLIRLVLNARKRHVEVLRWRIDGPDPAVVRYLTDFMRRPAKDMSWRQWLGQVLEDALVVDAAALYVWRRYDGSLYGLLPIDAGSITVNTDEHGLLPEPPEAAYYQSIMGDMVGLTTDELIYEVFNPRTVSQYGLPPMQVAAKLSSINLARMDSIAAEMNESNVPPFFGEVPEGWTPDQIAQWQRYWDAMVSGNKHKGLWGPSGANIYQFKKREIDTAYDEFLVRLICALFEVQPQEIGFTEDVNRSSAEVQEEIARRRSALPLAMFISEIIEQGFERAGFHGYRFVWPELHGPTQSELRESVRVGLMFDVLTKEQAFAILGFEEPLKDAQSNETNMPLTRAAKGKRYDMPEPASVPEITEAEREIKGGVLGAFKRQYDALAEKLKGITPPDDLDILDVEAVRAWVREELRARIGDKRRLYRAASVEDWRVYILQALRDGLLTCSRVGAIIGAEALSDIVPPGGDDDIDEDLFATWVVETASEMAVQISNTTWDKVSNDVVSWIIDGGDYEDLLRRLEGTLLDDKRARLIAIDVTTIGYSYGSRAYWGFLSERYGLTIKRQWMTAKDDLVCRRCRALDGVVVGLDEPFPGVGMEAHAHPGCRCRAAPVVY